MDFTDRFDLYRYSIRAEAFIGNLLSQGYTFDDMIVEFESSHKKHWDNDILTCEKNGEKFVFRLSRDGLFDSLPEFLFLKPLEGGAEDQQMIMEFNNKQRTNTNVLFNPVENEVFHKRVELEIHENDILSSLHTYDFDVLKNFWRIDEDIANKYKAKFIKVLPLLHSIAGDFALTAKCLAYFLDVPVEWKIEKTILPVQLSEDKEVEGLGDYYCGENMIMSGPLFEISHLFLVKIGPVPANEIIQYLENGEKNNMIKYFGSYFLPLEYNLAIDLEVNSSDLQFSLENSYLGFNSSPN
jgi:hypothetical protein